jgi:DNA-binding NarL/FixJ family response regulator
MNRNRTGAVLAVSLNAGDEQALESLFHQLPRKLKKAETIAQGMRQAMSGAVRVVICEPELPGGTWRNLCNTIGELAHPPRLIVASRLADDSLWAEVLNLGGYDVLLTPFDSEEVRRVLWNAMESGPRMDAGRNTQLPRQEIHCRR